MHRTIRHKQIWTAIILPLSIGSCTGLNLFFGPDPTPGPQPATELEIGIAVAVPATTVAAANGASVTIQWADIATVPGTVVRLQAQREAQPQAFTGPVILLIGDGNPGSGRDALADGDNDKFEWDLTGVPIGDYMITATIESPDGATQTTFSRDPDLGSSGIIQVTTTLPVPTLTFTAPVTDTNVTTGNTTNITWTDNGDDNAVALLTLGLDTDTDHNNGNEIILLRDQLLSADGNTGQFTFAFQDENGETVPDGTYTVFARLSDNAHDAVTVEAAGKLILNP
jgi:hypothetical protein